MEGNVSKGTGITTRKEITDKTPHNKGRNPKDTKTSEVPEGIMNSSLITNITIQISVKVKSKRNYFLNLK
jgi:hypothetical protein